MQRDLLDRKDSCLCLADHDLIFYGIHAFKIRKDYVPDIYTPDGPDSGSYKDQYILDGITVEDGWWHNFYYYSPEPHQKYTLWSAGPNGRTFPPWVPRDDSKMNQCVAVWTVDDIIHMSN